MQSDRERIIELFVKRKPRYTVADVLRLTCTSEAALARAVTERDIAPPESGMLAWEDVVYLVQGRWTPRMIDAALGQQRVGVIPPLNRVQHIEARLPLYQIRLLHFLAEQERGTIRARLNASDILERELHSMASGVDDLDEIEAVVPGFRAALHYPYVISSDDNVAFCRYCGRVSDIVGRELCEDCRNRHQPQTHLGRHGIPELDAIPGDDTDE